MKTAFTFVIVLVSFLSGCASNQFKTFENDPSAAKVFAFGNEKLAKLTVCQLDKKTVARGFQVISVEANKPTYVKLLERKSFSSKKFCTTSTLFKPKEGESYSLEMHFIKNKCYLTVTNDVTQNKVSHEAKTVEDLTGFYIASQRDASNRSCRAVVNGELNADYIDKDIEVMKAIGQLVKKGAEQKN